MSLYAFGNSKVVYSLVNVSLCYSRMDNKESCDKVIGALNGVLLHGGKDPLTIKFADSTNKKKQSQSKSLAAIDVLREVVQFPWFVSLL